MICNNCGCTFDEADVSTVREDYGEIHSICPMCGSPDLGETTQCDICGEEYREEELACDLCAKCLREAIDYDVALAYLKETDRLTDFMLTRRYGCGSLDGSSPEFDELMETIFREEAKNEKFAVKALRSSVSVLIDLLRDYIMPNFPELRSDEWEFADWYQTYREEHGV